VSDTVPERLVKSIQPGTRVAWYMADSSTARAIYDFGEADPLEAVHEK
jgi:hypothetical protein